MQDETLRILKEEYFYLQKVIDDFDSKSMLIKSWSITYSLTAIGLAVFNKSIGILIVAFLSGICFWIVESFWKSFQFMNYKRIYDIENAISGNGNTDIFPLQISSAWISEWKRSKKKKVINFFFKPYVALPHLLVCIVSLAIFIHEIISKYFYK